MSIGCKVLASVAIFIHTIILALALRILPFVGGFCQIILSGVRG
jgi:hypothetical protein